MPDILNSIISKNSEVPANAAGASSVSSEFKDIFAGYETPTNKFAENLIFDPNIERQTLQLSDEDLNSYLKYDVHIDSKDTVEELNKKRAENQSTIEQLAYGLGRSANEVLTGTIVGFADLLMMDVDFLGNVIAKQQGLQYHNVVSEALHNLKDNIDKAMPIYRENPDKAFDVSDFAWYMENMPSVFSTISLLIPSNAAVKVASYLGKLKYISKLGTKVADALNMSNNARKVAQIAGKSIIGGTTSRAIENYQEAQQARDEVYKWATAELQKMSKQDRDKLVEENKDFEGLTDEQIAEKLAQYAASTTFVEDWANVGFDILQYYTLRNFWNKPLESINPGRRLTRINKAAAKMFGSEEAAIKDNIANRSILNKIGNKAKDFAYDTFNLTRAEWTEGVEEAVNFIAQEDGVWAAKKLFGEDAGNHKNRYSLFSGNVEQLYDYAQDPHLWEQFVWGALGGILFRGVQEHAAPYVMRKLGKTNQTVEQQKEAEIYGRASTFAQYKNKIDKINSGLNPYRKDAPINPDEKDALLAIAENEYVTDLTINAANAGNLNLLEEFMQDTETINGFVEKLGISKEDAIALSSKAKENIASVKTVYENMFNRAIKNGADFELARIIADKYTKSSFNATTFSKLKDIAQTEYNSKLNLNPKDNTFNEKDISDYIMYDYIAKLDDMILDLDVDTTITDSERAFRIAEIEKNKNTIKSLFDYDYFKENKDKGISEYNKLKNSNSDLADALVKNVHSRIQEEIAIKEANPTDNELKNYISDTYKFADKAKVEILKDSFDSLKKYYAKYGKTEVNSFINTGRSSVISDEDKTDIKNSYTALSIDEESGKDLSSKLNVVANVQEAIRNQQESNPIEEEPEGLGVETETPTQEEQPVQKEVIPPDIVPEEPVSAVEEQNPSPVGKNDNNQETDPYVLSFDDNISNFSLSGTAFAFSYINSYAGNLNDLFDENSQFMKVLNRSVSLTGHEHFKNQAMRVLNGVIGTKNSIIEDGTDGQHYAKAFKAVVNFILKNNSQNLEEVLKEYLAAVANDDRFGGVKIDNDYYVSTSDLYNFFNGITQDQINFVNDYLFAALKEVIRKNYKNIHFVDIDVISKLTENDSFKSYATEDIQKRLNRVKINSKNYVNLDDLNNESVYNEFTKLKPNDVLETKVEKDIISLNHNGVKIGIIGLPKVGEDGTYFGVNKFWKYDLVKNGDNVDSKLKDAIYNIFVSNEPNYINVYQSFKELISNNDKKSEDYIKFLNSLPQELSNFLDKDNIKTDSDKVEAGKHLYNILKNAFAEKEKNQLKSIDNWFNNVFVGYDQALTIAEGHYTGNVTVSDITYGILNNDDNVYNDIEENIANYSEKENPIMVVLSSVNGNSSVTGIKSNGELKLNPNQTVGKSYIKITAPTGDDIYYAELQQQAVASLTSKNPFINGVLNGLTDILFDFVDKNISIEETYKNITQILGYNGLINSDVKVTWNKFKTGFFINYKDINGNKQSIIINNYNKNSVKNLIFNVENNNGKYNVDINGRYSGYKATQTLNQNEKNYIRNQLLKDIAIAIKDANIAISGKLITDSTRDNDTTTNKYIYRENGKTVVKIDGFEKSYNSYQDFLVKEKLIKAKINKTNGIVDGNATSGNFRYSTNAKLIISFNLDNVPTESINDLNNQTTRETTILFEKLTAGKTLNERQFINNILKKDDIVVALEDYFSRDSFASNWFKQLKALGILPQNVVVSESYQSGVKDSVKADYRNGVITLYAPNLKGRKLSDIIRIITHEAIHKNLAENKTKEQRDKLLKDIEKVYDRFVEIVDEKNTDFAFINGTKDIKSWGKEKHYTPKEIKLLSQYKFDGLPKEDKLEEFLVESLTSYNLMTLLNDIKMSDNSNKSKESLFDKILDLFAELFGIKINKDSALEALHNIYKEDNIVSIPTPRKEDVNVRKNIQLSFDFAEEQQEPIVETKPEEKTEDIVKTVEQISDEDLNDVFDILGGFNSTAEDLIPTVNTLKASVPLSIQDAFGHLLASGDISFVCK